MQQDGAGAALAEDQYCGLEAAALILRQLGALLGYRCPPRPIRTDQLPHLAQQGGGY